MAESEGFEPPIALRLCLISSQVHSTGLCQLSALSHCGSITCSVATKLNAVGSMRNRLQSCGKRCWIPRQAMWTGQLSRWDIASSPRRVYRQRPVGCNVSEGGPGSLGRGGVPPDWSRFQQDTGRGDGRLSRTRSPNLAGYTLHNHYD